MRAGAVVAIAMVLHAASAQAATPVLAPADVLTDKLELAFRACSLQLTQHDYLTDKNRTVLDGQGITLGPAPADVQGMAARLFGTSGIYAAVKTPAGQLWIAASATVPACKVTLGDTDLALTARMNWTGKLRSTAGWTYDPARSGGNRQFMREFLVLNASRAGGHLVTFVDGPNTIYNEGKGIQMIMTVALEPAKAQ
jgi:hypothetical protein